MCTKQSLPTSLISTDIKRINGFIYRITLMRDSFFNNYNLTQSLQIDCQQTQSELMDQINRLQLMGDEKEYVKKKASILRTKSKLKMQTKSLEKLIR